MANRLRAVLPILFLWSCGNTENKPEALARRHCSSCHAFVEPSMLDKRTWESGVFPEMAFRVGLDVSGLSDIDEADMPTVLRSLPEHPSISEEDWKLILEYYLKNAPDSLQVPDAGTFLPLAQFKPISIPLSGRSNTLLTLMKFDTSRQKFFVGNRRSVLYQLNSSLNVEDSFRLESPPSDIVFRHPEDPLLLCMGMMDPNDRTEGVVLQLDIQTKSHGIILDSLKRPVDLAYADLNGDGKQDFIISEFGNFTGHLNAYQQTGENEYRSHFIHNFPGTRKTIVRDMNGDGMPDILALITQGDEQIALFTNRGDFRFSYQVLLKFPAVYGSSFFDLCDFNDDGFPDILYTNGHNGDYSYLLKPYHGVRIFMNDGKNAFKESFFFLMHGASMAEALDYDEDGDLDIAAISFFPDFENHPEHGFIYLENRDGSFIPYTTPLAASGRWITMDSADIDSDGDTDILIGALDFPTFVPEKLVKKWGEEKISMLVFRNNLR